MIINLRGNSGSGKSTIVRGIMGQYKHIVPVHVAGRKQPLYYKLWQYGPPFGSPYRPDLIILGHYGSACGGCDTIHQFSLVVQLVYEASTMAKHVLFEGLLFSGDMKHCKEIHEGFGPEKFVVFALNTPLDVCLASINARRHAKDPSKPPVDPTNTENRCRPIQSASRHLEAAGVNICHVTRDECIQHLETILLGF